MTNETPPKEQYAQRAPQDYKKIEIDSLFSKLLLDFKELSNHPTVRGTRNQEVDTQFVQMMSRARTPITNAEKYAVAIIKKLRRMNPQGFEQFVGSSCAHLSLYCGSDGFLNSCLGTKSGDVYVKTAERPPGSRVISYLRPRRGGNGGRGNGGGGRGGGGGRRDNSRRDNSRRDNSRRDNSRREDRRSPIVLDLESQVELMNKINQNPEATRTYMAALQQHFLTPPKETTAPVEDHPKAPPAPTKILQKAPPAPTEDHPEAPPAPIEDHPKAAPPAKETTAPTKAPQPPKSPPEEKTEVPLVWNPTAATATKSWADYDDEDD